MNLEKLKDTARKFEQKEDWRRAIEVYLKAIQQIESGQETSPDLSLYNRVGDLYLKTNDVAAAVRSYERAVDLYADQGFFNNAIALCGKILRVNPGRTQTYLKLAQLHARKNVVIEAKRNLIEFLERMNALGQLDLAFGSVKEFADQFSGSQEIRMMLVELLRATSREEEAREQLEKLAGEIEGRGFDRPAPTPEHEQAPAAQQEQEQAPRPTRQAPAGLVFLDTGMDLSTPASPPEPGEVAPAEGLVLSDPSDAGLEPVAELVPGLEQGTELDDLEVPAVEDLERIVPGEIEFIGEPLEGMDEPAPDLIEDSALLEATSDDLVVTPPGQPIHDETAGEIDLELIQPELEADLEDHAVESAADATPLGGLPLVAVDTSGPSDLSELENLILDDPDNPDLHLQLGDRLLDGGDEIRGLEELELALSGFERLSDWPRASDIAERLTNLAPDVIRYHQKRVELAFRSGDRAPLLGAYLALGDALARAGAHDKAIAVFGRVEEHDPGNTHATAALAALRGEAEATVDQRAAALPPGPAAPAGVPRTAAEGPPPKPPASPPPPPSPRAAATADAFIDLGSMIIDEGGPRDTRMRIDRADPKDQDEQKEFQEILEQFKRGIEQNLDAEDYEAHYDLGVAFKEMGLLDEAIAEFQKALRSPDGRLRTSEALGICFYDKGQYGISETVLRRAVEAVEGGDEAKIGLLYWLGRAAEAQGKEIEAITSYERALAVDIRFMDLSDRMHRLAADRRK